MKELEDKKTEAEVLKALLVEFPDLKISTDRWRRQRYTSRTVNARATQVDFRHNCGCCPDSPLEARPYIETMGVQVFAQPDRYFVGERYDGIYEYEASGWEERMRKEDISDAAIEKVRAYLAAHEPPPYRDAFEDDDDDLDDEPEPLF